MLISRQSGHWQQPRKAGVAPLRVLWITPPDQMRESSASPLREDVVRCGQGSISTGCLKSDNKRRAETQPSIAQVRFFLAITLEGEAYFPRFGRAHWVHRSHSSQRGGGNEESEQLAESEDYLQPAPPYSGEKSELEDEIADVLRYIRRINERFVAELHSDDSVSSEPHQLLNGNDDQE